MIIQKIWSTSLAYFRNCKELLYYSPNLNVNFARMILPLQSSKTKLYEIFARDIFDTESP